MKKILSGLCINPYFRIFLISFLYRLQLIGFNFSFFKEKFLVSFETQYSKQLRVNLIDYLNYEHTKPVIYLIRDFFSVLVYPSNIQLINFLLLNIFNLISCFILYFLLRRINSSKLTALVLATFYSVSMVTWEFWRFSSHFDHFYPGSFLYLAFAIYILLVYKNMKSIILCGVVFSLFSISNTIGIIVAIITLLVLSLKVKWRSLYVFSIVIVLYLFASSNNISRFNTPLLSTISGQNLLQFVWIGVNNDEFMVDFLNNSELPFWYKLYFNKSYETKGRIGSIYGSYYRDILIDKKYLNDKKSLNNDVLLKDKILKMYINEDLKTERFKNYLFLAGVGESNTHFHVLYGKYSKELAIKIIKERPLIYLKTIIKALFYSLLGVFFFSGFIYEPQLINLPLYHKLFCLGFSPVYILGYLSSFIIIFYCILLKFHNKIVDISNFDHKLFFLFNISLIVIAYIILTSMTACCENSRYSVSISGLLILEFVFLFNIFSKAYKRYFL